MDSKIDSSALRNVLSKTIHNKLRQRSKLKSTSITLTAYHTIIPVLFKCIASQKYSYSCYVQNNNWRNIFGRFILFYTKITAPLRTLLQN